MTTQSPNDHDEPPLGEPMVHQPLEPMYTLRVAAEMIPFVNVGALRDWLHRHPEFPTRITPIARRRHRMLLLSELAQIRAMRVKEIPRAAPRAAPRDAPRRGATPTTRKTGPIIPA